MTIFTILFTAALVNNFVLSQFMGICPFLGVSKKVETAAGMGGAVVFVITIASLCTSILYNYLLVPAQLEYLNTIVFILVIAALVQFVEMVLKKMMPALYKSLGVYLPLITTNCAVLGVALLSVQNEYGVLESVVNGIGASLGFLLAIVLMAGIREKLENSNIPEAFQRYTDRADHSRSYGDCVLWLRRRGILKKGANSYEYDTYFDGAPWSSWNRYRSFAWCSR